MASNGNISLLQYRYLGLACFDMFHAIEKTNEFKRIVVDHRSYDGYSLTVICSVLLTKENIH